MKKTPSQDDLSRRIMRELAASEKIEAEILADPDLKLTDVEGLAILLASEGHVEARIKRTVEDVEAGRIPNPVLRYNPITVADKGYDGPQDKTIRVTLDPTFRPAVVFAVILETYREPVGFLVFRRFMRSQLKAELAARHPGKDSADEDPTSP